LSLSELQLRDARVAVLEAAGARDGGALAPAPIALSDDAVFAARRRRRLQVCYIGQTQEQTQKACLPGAPLVGAAESRARSRRSESGLAAPPRALLARRRSTSHILRALQVSIAARHDTESLLPLPRDVALHSVEGGEVPGKVW
jgi:hypothetical protein